MLYKYNVFGKHKYMENIAQIFSESKILQENFNNISYYANNLC